MRVLMTLDAVGGVARYALDLTRALAGRGVDVVLAGLGPAPSPWLEAECQSLDNAELVWLPLPLDWMTDDERAVTATSAALAALAEEHRADLLHLNAPAQAAGLGRTAGDRPVVCASHSCMATWWRAVRRTPLPADWRWRAAAEARGLSAADVVLAPSDAHAAALRAVYGPLPALRVIPNATALRRVGGPRQPYAFAAGRWWDEGKGAAVLDAAAATSPWTIAAAGAAAGPTGQHHAFTAAMPLGVLPPEAVQGHLRRAGAFVSPSLYEPFGLGVLEAARSGCPLVLSDIDTFRGLWDGAALFFPAGDGAALAAALERLAGDAALRGRLGEAASLRSEAYTPGRQADLVLAAYRQAIASRHGAEAA
jgi:glycosyltransferase involved in cell wall biosynthesis